MGKTQSKEEVIIAQSGNSGGQTSTTSQENDKGVSRLEVFMWIFCTIILAALFVYCCIRIKKGIEKKIRREIRRSQELV